MVINITIHKIFSIHDSVNKLVIATMSSTKKYQYFQSFNIHKTIQMKK